MVQWLRNLSGNAEDAGSIPGQETKIPHAVEQLSSQAPQLLSQSTTEPVCHN